MPVRTLQVGMTGDDVKGMQLALNKHLAGSGTLGPKIGDGSLKPLDTNGVFDAAMERLVRAFQVANGLAENGTIDEPTRYALFPMGILSVVVAINRLKRPWLLEPREPSWGRPPRLLPRLQLSDDQSPLGPTETAGVSAGAGKRSKSLPATSLDAPWLLEPRQPHWRSPPALVPPLQMPAHDPAPRPAPLTANMDGRRLSPGSRTLDLSGVDWDSSKWVPRRPTIDCSNIDWPMSFPQPLAIDWSKVRLWQDDGSITNILARPLSDTFPAPVLPSVKAQDIPASQDQSTGIVFDHDEFAYGHQWSWMSDGSTPQAAIISFQLVYRIGSADTRHFELGGGFQLGKPLNVVTGDGDSVSINPYFYFSDVDRYWQFGKFHVWQPLAQVGYQATPKSPLKLWNPTLTGSVCPVNVEYDPSDWLKINLQGCGVANYGLDNGSLVGGVQASATMTVSFEKVYGSLNSLFPNLFHF